MSKFCEAYNVGGWTITAAASSYAQVAGIFAAVMLPFLAIIIQTMPDTAERPYRRRLPLLVVAAFIFSLTAAYYYSLLSGDQYCVRANMVSIPASVIFGIGAALSLVAICWLGEHPMLGDRASRWFIAMSFGGFLLIIGESIVSCLAFVAIANGLHTGGFPPWWQSLVIALPGLGAIGVGTLHYVRASALLSLPLGDAAEDGPLIRTLRRVQKWLSASIFAFVDRKLVTRAVSMKVLLAATYVVCAGGSAVMENVTFSSPKAGFWWVLAGIVMATVFGLSFAVVINLLPPVTPFVETAADKVVPAAPVPDGEGPETASGEDSQAERDTEASS